MAPEDDKRKKRRREIESSDEDDLLSHNSDSKKRTQRQRSNSPSRRHHKSHRDSRSSSRRDRISSLSTDSESESDDTANKKKSHRKVSDDATNKKKSCRKVTDEEVMEYLVKKAQKRDAKVAKKLKTQKVSGYSNDSNPFGDSNLNEKLKSRRLKNVGEKQQLKKPSTRRKWEHARAEFQDWEKKEEEFHFDQSKLRLEIRLREGRAKPIDVLTKNLDLADDFDNDLNEPYAIFKGLTVKEMEELHEDIKMHLELDREIPTHIEYWEALMVVCDWEIVEARKRDALDRARMLGVEPPPELLAEERGLHSSIDEVLQGESYDKLHEWQCQIESQMLSGDAKNVEFFEAVLKRLQIYKAKARLREIHADFLRHHLQRPQESGNEQQAPKEDVDKDHEIEYREKVIEDNGPHSPEAIPVEENIKELEEEPGSFLPQLLHNYEEEALDPEADKAELERKRAAVLKTQQQRLQEAVAGPSTIDDLALTNKEREIAMKAMRALEEGDEVLGSDSEVNLESQVYWWHDKYRPRKPKYSNKVHTGYEWNKYNQTHYDQDNPPPKIVQGYKIEIKYLYLVDKTKAPTYAIEKDGSNGETCMIRFHGGPPYEDIVCFSRPLL